MLRSDAVKNDFLYVLLGFEVVYQIIYMKMDLKSYLNLIQHIKNLKKRI